MTEAAPTIELLEAIWGTVIPRLHDGADDDPSLVPEYPSVKIHSYNSASTTTPHVDMKCRMMEMPTICAVAMETRIKSKEVGADAGRFFITGEARELADIITSDRLSRQNGRMSRQLFKLLNYAGCTHEVCLESLPGRPSPVYGFIDAEIKKNAAKSGSSFSATNVLPVGDAAELTIVKHCIKLYVDQLRICLGDAFPSYLLKEDGETFYDESSVVILQGSRAEKFSYHIVFKCFLWESNYHQEQFVNDFIKPQLNRTFPFNSYHGQIIDLSYGSWKTMRMWNCHHAIFEDDWDKTARRVKDGVTLHRLKLVSKLPFTAMSPCEILMWTSLTMNTHLSDINCRYATSRAIIQRPFRHTREEILSDRGRVGKFDPNDAFVVNFVSIMEDALRFWVCDPTTHGRKVYKFGDLWPRSDIILVRKHGSLQMENTVFEFSPALFREKVLEIFYRGPKERGTVCLRKGINIYDFQTHESCNVSFVLKGNGMITHGCFFPHEDKALIKFGKIGELMEQAQRNAEEEKRMSVDAAVKKELEEQRKRKVEHEEVTEQARKKSKPTESLREID